MTHIRLHPELDKVRHELGYSEWTDIQEKTIPLIQQGRDVIGQSHTGSGKTAAFGFPILEKVMPRAGLQCLVLVPTRELCEQVASELKKFARHKHMKIAAIYGGVAISPQVQLLSYAEIVVGTPGRILDHLSHGTLDTSRINILVLDEADKMFEMGFIIDVKKIISGLPAERQTLLFSATVSQEVHDIVKHFMRNPERVKIQDYVDKEMMLQEFYTVESRDKFSLLVHILRQEKPKLAIIFCGTRTRVDEVSKSLYRQGIRSLTLHGGLSQNRRKNAIDMFHANTSNILVASDVAARGLDIKNVSHVINYDIPRSLKEYVHRIGRTARAGSVGKVISLVSQQDHENFRLIYSDTSLNIEQKHAAHFARVPYIRKAFRHGFQGARQGRRGFGVRYQSR